MMRTRTFQATAATAPACSKCATTSVALVAATQAGLVKPTVKVIANTAAGCKRMNVVCTAATPAFMEFNRAVAGPYEGKTITATLVCGADLKWRFTKNAVTTIVTTAACYVVV
ncbi:hypothetical protein OESDEN_25019 [Oesophagostomum dentatum]|uniref:C6 domain-containing protein n=1 Tax=Oesophagostomum dentatum TaxID=61180 RepID=A0A0B1RWE0_OESDE|nr:hypothetical protein OESDEN_25019 [Oesophagostomum dentatum]